MTYSEAHDVLSRRLAAGRRRGSRRIVQAADYRLSAPISTACPRCGDLR